MKEPVQQIANEPVPEPAPVQYAQEEKSPIAPPPVVQPDVIPTQRESMQPEIIETLPPPAEFSSNTETITEDLPTTVQAQPAHVEEQIYSNITYAPTHGENDVNGGNSAALVGNEDCDLSEYIEDTKIQAIALYDYQATADDEISFDPNDIITHIEQVNV